MSHLKPTIILVDTQLAENIGLAARAMYNFGLANFQREAHLFPVMLRCYGVATGPIFWMR